MLIVFLDADGPAVKHGVVDLLPDLLLEPLLYGKKSARIFAAETIEQILAKQASDDWRIRVEPLKRSCPAITDQHRPMRRRVPSRRWLELGWRSLRVAQPK